MIRYFLIACTALMPVAGAQAADYSDQAAGTKGYYEKALAVYKQLGPDGAAKDFMVPKKWFEKDQFGLHVGLILNDTNTVADSGFPELVGTKYNDVDDLDGKALGPAVTKAVAKSPAGAPVTLRFAIPNSTHAGHCEGYCAQADKDHILCAWSEVPER